MAFQGEGVLRIAAQPLRLLFQGSDRLLRQLRGVDLEPHAVANIHDEVLLATGRCGAGIRHRGVLFGGIPRARANTQRGDEKTRKSH